MIHDDDVDDNEDAGDALEDPFEATSPIAEDTADALTTSPRAEDAANIESSVAAHVEDAVLRCEEDAPAPSDTAEKSVLAAASASLD